jgi:hypothetical protein
MCKTYPSCSDCPAKLDGGICGIRCSRYDYAPDKKVTIVEQWAKEHPRKTRQSVFLEHYPEAKRSEDGVLTICPMAVSAAYRNEKGGCKTYSCVCDDCRREFWLEEVE